jgi:hypothetical protein
MYDVSNALQPGTLNWCRLDLSPQGIDLNNVMAEDFATYQLAGGWTSTFSAESDFSY